MKQQENLEYWSQRAKDIKDDDLVTHQDLFQKRLELELIRPHLQSGMQVLEVGCGNGFASGFLAERVARVDAFDVSEEMVQRARQRLAAKTNCRFFVKSLPSPSPDGLEPQYDAVLSVRVLINLPDEDAQARAIDWIAGKLKPGGRFIMLEGSHEGLEALNDLRASAGLSRIQAAAFNLNLKRDWIKKTASHYFTIHSQESIGVYDFLTRFFYPMFVGEEHVEYNTKFHETAFQAAKVASADGSVAALSRLHVYVFTKQ